MIKAFLVVLLVTISSRVSNSFVILDPVTGRESAVITAETSNDQENRGLGQLYLQDYFRSESDIDFSNPAKKFSIPAPEYFGQDGKTPIFKIIKKSPYGHK